MTRTTTRYIIETATGAHRRRILGDAVSLLDAHTMCMIAMSTGRQDGGPDFAFALDEDGRWVVALERMDDGTIIDHLIMRDRPQCVNAEKQ